MLFPGLFGKQENINLNWIKGNWQWAAVLIVKNFVLGKTQTASWWFYLFLNSVSNTSLCWSTRPRVPSSFNHFPNKKLKLRSIVAGSGESGDWWVWWGEKRIDLISIMATLWENIIVHCDKLISEIRSDLPNARSERWHCIFLCQPWDERDEKDSQTPH